MLAGDMGQNTFEVMLENNPVRAWVREAMEVKPLRAATDVGTIGHALHIACGNASATRLLLKHFTVERVSGVDRDPAVIEAARADPPLPGSDFTVQDVRSLSFADATFDAAFDLADLHNYPEWRDGVRELWRVLKPGGLLVMEEITRETFSHGAGRLFKALTEHPYDAMLDAAALRACMLQTGFRILHDEERNPLGLFRYYIMAARKG
jgi:ubiquinone/menaquinone biosynthesis C-methylase UbiE